MDENGIITAIAEAFRADLSESEDCWLFELHARGIDRSIPLAKDKLRNAIEALKALDTVSETAISGSRKYEALVREESAFPRLHWRIRDEGVTLDDGDNGIRYRLATPTEEYILFLIDSVARVASLRSLLGPRPIGMLFDRSDTDEDIGIFDLLRRAIPRFLSLQIESDKDRSATDMARFADSFFFEVGYNVDCAIVPQRYLEEVLRTGRIAGLRRGRFDDIDAPRRHYLPDLIYHYALAVGAENAFLQYISYYHVAEHFFDSVFWDDIVIRVKDRLTQPGFSYKRKKDITAIIKYIRKAIDIRDESLTFSEQTALKLTLEKYVDLDRLKIEINEYDETLLDHYGSATVSFSGGDVIDLQSTDQVALFAALAARVYKTRCAMVHSKDGDKARYMPFKDDHILVKEIPLIRFIAEQIIIETSSILG